MEADEFGTVLFRFSISLSEAGLNEVRVQLLQGRYLGSIQGASEPCSRQPFTPLF